MMLKGLCASIRNYYHGIKNQVGEKVGASTLSQNILPNPLEII